MPGIWRKAGDEWVPMKAGPVPDEKELQARIVDILGKDPKALPLAGQPEITVVGQYVATGSGEADVVAIERSGRPVIIEAKLYKNREARRQMVAQALEYAADLHRLTVREFERDLLGPSLQESSLADAVGEDDDDEENFYKELAEHLARGSFRIVFLLDRAHPVLVKLVGYLETITADRIIVDLVTATSYELGQEHIFQTQRIDPERAPEPPPSWVKPPRPTGTIRTEGSKRFREMNDESEDDQTAAHGRRLADWAEALENEGICRVYSAESKDGRAQIRPQLLNESRAFAHLWPEPSGIGAWLYPTVIGRRAPAMLGRIRELTGVQGNKGGAPATPELLDALADAYREAAGVASSP